MAAGHDTLAPMAKGVLLVDYDGTLFPWGPLDDESPPLPGAVEAMRDLKKAGYTLRIYSSRLARTWLSAAGEDFQQQVDHMTKMLDRYGIPYDGFATDKEPAEAYIDDRAIRFDGNWLKISGQLIWNAGHEHVYDTMWVTPDGTYWFCGCGEQKA